MKLSASGFLGSHIAWISSQKLFVRPFRAFAHKYCIDAKCTVYRSWCDCLLLVGWQLPYIVLSTQLKHILLDYSMFTHSIIVPTERIHRLFVSLQLIILRL